MVPFAWCTLRLQLVFPVQDEIAAWKAGYKEPTGLKLAKKINFVRRDKAVKQYGFRPLQFVILSCPHLCGDALHRYTAELIEEHIEAKVYAAEKKVRVLKGVEEGVPSPLTLICFLCVSHMRAPSLGRVRRTRILVCVCGQMRAVLPRMRRVLESWRNANLLRVFDGWKQWYYLTRLERLAASAADERAAK